MNRKAARLRRAMKTRARIRRQKQVRLCVIRSPRHISVQVISECGGKVLACASTQEKDIKSGLKSTGNVEAAKLIGQTIAQRAKAAGVTQVAFDRSGFKYHGRVKALADAAREGGLDF